MDSRAYIEDIGEAMKVRDETKACQLIQAAVSHGMYDLPIPLIFEAIHTNMESTAKALLGYMVSSTGGSSLLSIDILNAACRHAMYDFMSAVPDASLREALTMEPSLLQSVLAACNHQLPGVSTLSPKTRRRQEILVQGRLRQLIRLLVSKGGNPNQVTLDERCQTALHLMCQHPVDFKTVSFLLSQGADPNVKDGVGRTPLILALQQKPKDHQEVMDLRQVIQALVEAGADVNDSFVTAHGQIHWPLHLAIRHSAHITRLLLKHGADVNALDESGFPVLFYALFTSPEDRLTILSDLLQKEDLQLDFSPRNAQSVLHFSAMLKKEAFEATNLILQRRPDAKRFLNCPSRDGNTPLHDALRQGNYDAAAVLLSHGSWAHMVTHQFSGAHFSCLQLACGLQHKSRPVPFAHYAPVQKIAPASLLAAVLNKGMLSTHLHCALCDVTQTSGVSLHGSLYIVFRSLLEKIISNPFRADRVLHTLLYLLSQDVHFHLEWIERHALLLELNPQSSEFRGREASHIQSIREHLQEIPSLKQLCRRSIRETLSTKYAQVHGGFHLSWASQELPIPHLLQEYLVVQSE